MTRKHRFLTLLLALALLLGMAVTPAAAAGSTLLSAGLTPKDMADSLNGLGLFKGTDPNSATPRYDLDKPADRAAAATMLIRLLGKEQTAKAQYDAGTLPAAPFTDLDWEAATVTWLYANKLANGEEDTLFGGTNPVTAQMFATFILRALGYSDLGDNKDFNYVDALAFAVQKGIFTQTQSNEYQKQFLREGIVVMCYNALNLKMNNSSLTLRQKLANEGVIDQGNAGAARTLTLTEKYKGGGFEGLGYPEEQTQGNTVCSADIDGDGNLEIIFGVKSVFCVNAADGKLKWKNELNIDGSVYTRDTRAPIQVLDWDGDRNMEVFVMNFSDPDGYIRIIDKNGNIKKQWKLNVNNYQIRAVCPADIDNDGKYELIVGVGVGTDGAKKGDSAVYVYNNDLTLRWSKPLGYGVYSNSIITVDLNGDKQLEIVLTYDDTQIAAFKADGTKVNATAFGSGVTWDKVDFFANYDTVGYDADKLTTSELRNGIAGTYSGLIADDLGDGTGTKIIGVALINDVKMTADNMSGGYTAVNSYAGSAQYFAPFIINLDRTRYVNTARGFDWSSIPADTGDILTLKSGEDVLSDPNASVYPFLDADCRPVVADLDGDGVKEVLYTANDGQVHCFSLDGTEHGAWPFALNDRTTDIPDYIRYAGRPAVADLNGDGKLEVIFTTYSTRFQDDVRGKERGKLYVLDCTGKVLAEKELPPLWGRTSDAGLYANGSSTTPVVVDAGGRKMIVVMTFSCGLVGYEVN